MIFQRIQAVGPIELFFIFDIRYNRISPIQNFTKLCTVIEGLYAHFVMLTKHFVKFRRIKIQHLHPLINAEPFFYLRCV